MNLLDAGGTGFILRYLRRWVERWVCQLVGRQLFAPVVRDKDRVGADRLDDERRKDALAAPRDHAHALAVVDLQLHGRLRVNLDVRLGALFDEKAYATGLVARKIL